MSEIPGDDGLEESVLTEGQAWAQDGSSSMRQTRIGLSLVYWGIVILLLSLIFAFVVPTFVPVGLGGILAVAAAAGFGLLIGSLLTFIGPFFAWPYRPHPTRGD